MHAVVISNSGDADPGFVGERLAARGYDLHKLFREDHAKWSDERPDLVLMLGSDWSVYWDHVADAVEGESKYLRTAHEAGVPIFGICFGAQVISYALGGAAHRAPQPEIGWYLVDSEHEAIEPGPWFQWHVDACSPPPDALVMATSPAGPQAFRLGRTFAVQFHPEVNNETVARWATIGADELTRHHVEPDEMLARTQQETARTQHAAHRLVDWFLANVSAS